LYLLCTGKIAYIPQFLVEIWNQSCKEVGIQI
jgi:hypothetical protein